MKWTMSTAYRLPKESPQQSMKSNVTVSKRVLGSKMIFYHMLIVKTCDFLFFSFFSPALSSSLAACTVSTEMET